MDFNPNTSLRNAKVLVTGASGFTGSVLVRRLCEIGANVRAIARQSSSISHLSDLPIEWIRSEVYDPSAVARATNGIEYIFHVAAAFREAGIADEVYRLVHVESTKILASAVVGSANLKRFVHVSTVGVHGHIDRPPANEEFRFAPGDEYQRTKTEAEIWFRNFAAKNNIPWTVIRPAAIYGPGDRRLFKVFKMASKPFFPILGFGSCFYHLIHVEDLVGVLIRASVHPSALVNVFIAGNPEPSTLKSMALTISGTLGNKLRVIRLPAFPFFIAGALCELACKPFGIEPPIYRRRVAFFTKDRAFDTTKLQERLGYTYHYTTEQGLIETTKWYVENGWLSSASPAMEPSVASKHCG